MGIALTQQIKTAELQSILERHLPQPYRFCRELAPEWASVIRLRWVWGYRSRGAETPWVLALECQSASGWA